jgi:perosamine synthetase
MNKKIFMADPQFDAEERVEIHQEVENILSNSLSMGNNVRQFEREFAQKIGVKHAIAVNSCTAALEIVLASLNLRGCEVIVPTQTFIATGSAIKAAGGKPVFAEICGEDFCIDLEDIKQKRNELTRAIVLVHFAGNISNDAIRIKEYARKENLVLLEDAAHTPGAYVDDLQAGQIGDAACFSFYPTKIMTSGEGGMITTNNESIANFARSMQNRGRDMTSQKEIYEKIGRNVRMTEFSGLLGRIQLKKLDYNLERRRENAALYKECLKGNLLVRPLMPEAERQSSFWKVILLIDKTVPRAELIELLNSEGIATDTMYSPALHQQPVFINDSTVECSEMIKSESLMKRHICVPCHPGVMPEDIKLICRLINNYCNMYL